MNVRKIQAGGVRVGMLLAEVDEDVKLEDMDLESMDWQRVVEVQHLYGYRVVMTLFYKSSPKSGSHNVSGTYDQYVYVEVDDKEQPIVIETDDWACDFRD